MVLLLVHGLPADGQTFREDTDTWELGLRAGFASPKGDLGDLGDDGVFVGAGLGYGVGPRVALRVEVGFENLERGGRPRTLGGVRGPRIDVWHLLAGPELILTEPTATPWSVALTVEAGASYLDVTASLGESGGVPAQTGWKTTGYAGLVVGYELTRSLMVFARSGGYVMLGDARDPDDFLGKEASLENTLGLRVRLP